MAIIGRSVRIRDFVASDIEMVRCILSDTWPQCYGECGILSSIARLLEDEALSFLLPKAGKKACLAFVDEKAAGVLVTRRVHAVDYILGLYVRPAFQRMGLGKQMIVYFFSQARDVKTLRLK